jgi:hypothetical protein
MEKGVTLAIGVGRAVPSLIAATALSLAVPRDFTKIGR